MISIRRSIIMLKKTIGSLITVSALTIALGSVDSEASQWNNSSINQLQNASGWSSLYQNQNSNVADTSNKFSGANSTAQGQAVFVTGSQTQSGQSNGPATATNSQNTAVDVGDSTSDQTTTSQGAGTTEQSTSTSEPGYLLQSQRNTNAIFHFQGSVKGGASLQHQMAQGHSYQFSTAVTKP